MVAIEQDQLSSAVIEPNRTPTVGPLKIPLLEKSCVVRRKKDTLVAEPSSNLSMNPVLGSRGKLK